MSGAKNCPETPRQKMIGMMYLVLTAMLALNVSADIINGFTKLRHSMEESMESTSNRTEELFANFRQANEQEPTKYGPWWELADAVHGQCDSMYYYIEHFKLDIANAVDGKDYTEMPKKLVGGTDTHNAHRYALNETGPDGKTHGQELEDRMDAFREYLTKADSKILKEKVSPRLPNEDGDSVRNPHYDRVFADKWDSKVRMFDALFNTNDVEDEEGNNIPWNQSIFNEMPASAVVAMLTKYQNDICVAENELINFFYESAGASEHVVNKVEPLIMPTYGEYVMQGQRYRATIVSAMLDTTNKPQVIINGQEFADGIYEVPASQIGPHTYTGVMKIDDEEYPFEGHYIVGAPSAAIANVDLTTMYSGYDNVFRISVPGYGDDKLIVTCAGATVNRNGADWIIRPSGGKQSDIVVSVKDNNKIVEMGRQTWTVRPLPSPTVYLSFGGQENDAEKQPKKLLTSGAVSIVASYGPENPLKAKFTVESFGIEFPNGQVIKSSGNKISAAALKLLKSVKPGNNIIVCQVMAKGPDGKIRELKSLPIKLQ